MTMIPLAGERLIFELGWRNAWLIEGLVIWAVVVPMAILAIRNRPSDLGQHVDGDLHAPTDAPEVWGVTRREAMRTSFFWLVTLAVTATGNSHHRSCLPPDRPPGQSWADTRGSRGELHPADHRDVHRHAGHRCA
jgi:hypothetical protein